MTLYHNTSCQRKAYEIHLLGNHWTNLNQTWHNTFLNKGNLRFHIIKNYLIPQKEEIDIYAPKIKDWGGGILFLSCMSFCNSVILSPSLKL